MMRAVFFPMCRFHTRKNKIICSDPDDSWTKKAMVMVDRRKKLTMESSY